MDLDEAYRTVGDIARHAQTGEQEAAMWDLVDLTGSEEPELAWLAAAGALPGMWWSGAIAEAAEMAMRIVERFGADIVDRELPSDTRFDMAVVAGAVHGGTDLLPRLFEMASHLPPNSGLHQRLLWLADRATQDGGATAGLPGNLGDPRPLRKDEAKLAARPPARLTDRELRAVWRAAANAVDRDLALALWDSGCPRPLDDTPRLWQLAQILHEAGRAADSEQALLHAAATWWPFHVWESLPCTPVLNPGLRPALTDAVVTAYCRQPIALALHPPTA